MAHPYIVPIIFRVFFLFEVKYSDFRNYMGLLDSRILVSRSPRFSELGLFAVALSRILTSAVAILNIVTHSLGITALKLRIQIGNEIRSA